MIRLLNFSNNNIAKEIDSIERNLQKDSSLINKENLAPEKIESSRQRDTTQFIPEQHPKDSILIKDSAITKIDTTKKVISKHLSKRERKRISRKKKNNKISSEDTSRPVLKPQVKDSSAIADSLQKEIHQAPLDSLENYKPKDSTINDLLNLDSTKKSARNLPDSLKNDERLIADSSNKSDTSIRYFLAFHHVKIFNDSLQSICDSLFISSKDSVFRLYYNPVVWSGATQIEGDTIYLYTKNKQPERLYVFESGLIVNKTKEGFFNQMAGKTINGYFINGKIDYMRVKGTQAESIYYLQNDDSAYLGMNRAVGDVIDLYFKDDDLRKVLFINAVEGKMYPMNQIPEDQRRLKIFKWLEGERPKNKAELFE